MVGWKEEEVRITPACSICEYWRKGEEKERQKYIKKERRRKGENRGDGNEQYLIAVDIEVAHCVILRQSSCQCLCTLVANLLCSI
jgi:hypothetical protein